MNQVRGRRRLFAVRLYNKTPARGLTIASRGAFSSPRRNILPRRVKVKERGVAPRRQFDSLRWPHLGTSPAYPLPGGIPCLPGNASPNDWKRVRAAPSVKTSRSDQCHNVENASRWPHGWLRLLGTVPRLASRCLGCRRFGYRHLVSSPPQECSCPTMDRRGFSRSVFLSLNPQ